MNKRPKLVIFDCDGVLVDTEPATNEVLAANLTGYGYPVTASECIDTFVGGTMASIGEQMRASGVDLPADWTDEIYAAMFDRLAEGVDVIPGVEALMDRLDAESIPYCVGSNGPMEKMEITLVNTGLMVRLAGRVFSPHVIGLEHAKPAPGLYLHAVKTMGFEPFDAVVIEDTVNGANGARAAGIRCLGFTRDTPAEDLRSVGAEPFSNMQDVPELIGLN